jgi:hypothetical protein
MKEFLEKGYIPYGNPVANDGFIIQAFVLPAEKPMRDTNGDMFGEKKTI